MPSLGRATPWRSRPWRHWSGAISKCVYIIRRLMQAALVMVVMSVLVFVGVYAIGNPVEMLINPEADELEREARARRSASTSRCGGNTWCS